MEKFNELPTQVIVDVVIVWIFKGLLISTIEQWSTLNLISQSNRSQLLTFHGRNCPKSRRIFFVHRSLLRVSERPTQSSCRRDASELTLHSIESAGTHRSGRCLTKIRSCLCPVPRRHCPFCHDTYGIEGQIECMNSFLGRRSLYH